MMSGLFKTLARVFEHIERYGIFNGYRLWRHKLRKDRATLAYNIKGVTHPLYMRTASSDYETFLQIFWNNEYKYDLPFTPRVIIDCGANIGLTSVYYANLYPDATIIAVEPASTNFEILKLNTQGYSNIKCLQMGIWDKTTNLEIEDNTVSEWAFTVKESAQPTADSFEAISIPGMMNKYGFDTIDILKMDIEGSEKQVFSAADTSWLYKTRLLIVELHDWMVGGTAKPFFNAINSIPYHLTINGENIFCLLGDAAKNKR